MKKYIRISTLSVLVLLASQFLETLSVKLQKLVAVERETNPIVKFTRSAYTDKKPQLIGASYA